MILVTIDSVDLSPNRCHGIAKSDVDLLLILLGNEVQL